MTAMTARAPKLEARNRRVLRVLLGIIAALAGATLLAGVLQR